MAIEVCEGICFLVGQMQLPLLYLLLLPIFYSLNNDGSCCCDEKLWEDAAIALTKEKKLVSSRKE